MKRRTLLQLSLLAAAARPATPQGPSLPGPLYREYARCLPDYLRLLAQESYTNRNRALAAITTPEDVRRRQRWARETFWRLIGGEPERTPLNTRVVGSFKRDGYRVERIVYETRPEFFVPANLYIPTNAQPPFPGVLFQMGHSLNGKAAGVYQKCCQGLARLGYLTLGFDPMGQGERAYYPREGGYMTRLSSADAEHTVPGKQMILAGDTSTRLQVWDAVRSLDVLAAHPQVDPKRLASTGNSGGGTLTMMLSAVDDRLTAAAASCPNTENLACADFNPPGCTDDAEQNFLDCGPAGFGRWDMLYPLAPKPLLILVSGRDFFGTYSPNYIANGREEYVKLRRQYEILGAADKIEWFSSPLPHGLHYNMRLRIYNWFERFLKGNPGHLTEEPPVKPEDDETLRVGSGGNVMVSFGSETPFSMNRHRAAAIRTPRDVPDLGGLLRADMPSAALEATSKGAVPSGPLNVEVIEVPSAKDVWLPAYFFQRRQADRSKPLILALEPSGRVLHWREDELYQELAAEGFPVCLPDLRGLGDLRPEFPRGAPGHGSYHQSEEHYSWACTMLGKPLVGQRVTDILALLAALRNHESGQGRRFVIAARGTVTVPALFAAALDPKVDRVFLSGGVASYRSIVEAAEFDHPFCNFLYNVLPQTDLPQIAASIAPREVHLSGTVDGAGKQLDQDAIRDIYAGASNIQLLPDLPWNVSTLTRIATG